jgi:hypothetical protein
MEQGIRIKDLQKDDEFIHDGSTFKVREVNETTIRCVHYDVRREHTKGRLLIFGAKAQAKVLLLRCG